MSSFYLIVKRGETSLRLGYSTQQVHIIIIIITVSRYFSCNRYGAVTTEADTQSLKKFSIAEQFDLYLLIPVIILWITREL